MPVLRHRYTAMDQKSPPRAGLLKSGILAVTFTLARLAEPAVILACGEKSLFEVHHRRPG
jgi:hypothetical protein